eukprot:scaffold13715_cov69-Phaeocystis_antarctica.AAC.2
MTHAGARLPQSADLGPAAVCTFARRACTGLSHRLPSSVSLATIYRHTTHCVGQKWPSNTNSMVSRRPNREADDIFHKRSYNFRILEIKKVLDDCDGRRGLSNLKDLKCDNHCHETLKRYTPL